MTIRRFGSTEAKSASVSLNALVASFHPFLTM